jgi:hypothetical protein
MTTITVSGSSNNSNLVVGSTGASINDSDAGINNFKIYKKYVGNFDIYSCDSSGNIIYDFSSNGRIIYVDYLDNIYGKIIGYSFMGMEGETLTDHGSKNIGYISSYNSSNVYVTLRASSDSSPFEEWVISENGKIIHSRYTTINQTTMTSRLWIGKFTALS